MSKTTCPPIHTVVGTNRLSRLKQEHPVRTASAFYALILVGLLASVLLFSLPPIGYAAIAVGATIGGVVFAVTAVRLTHTHPSVRQ